MMLAAVETVTKADPVWESRRHNSDLAAQATAGESVHAASPRKSSGRNGYDEQHRHCNCPLRAGTRRSSVAGRTAKGRHDRRYPRPSAWLDIDGEADSKWRPAEGDLAVDLLRRIASAGITEPDLFIITTLRRPGCQRSPERKPSTIPPNTRSPWISYQQPQ
jgi:hypothetical protein